MGGTGRRADEISRALHEAWVRGPHGDSAKALATLMPVPGSVALRGRFHFLTDPAVPVLAVEQFQVPWITWDRQVTLTQAADAALVANDVPAARAALAELRSTHQPGRHPLPMVDALVGLGDAARQADRFEEAAEHYEAALALASQAHYRFGVVRALVPVGYLTMLAGSARQAADTFREAAGLARELDERVYLAGALTGLGEALGRLHDDDGARQALAEALSLFEFLRSDVGIVNAAQHLGDLYRRGKALREAKTVLTRALEVATKSGAWIGEVNASDSLGEVTLGLRDLAGAVGFYEHAYRMSAGRGYRRGQAHALNGLGRCAAAAGEWPEAGQLHEAALEGYRDLGDPASSATALDGIASAASAVGDKARAMRARLDAVAAIEEMRSSQDLHQYQQEYRERFASVYSAAVRAAVQADDPAGFVAVFESLAGRRLAGMLEKLPLYGDDLAEPSSAERRAALIGRLASRRPMTETAERAIADAAAALYRPFAPDAAPPLLHRAAAASHLLLVTSVPDRDTEIAWLRARPDKPCQTGTHALPAASRDLVASLAREGLSSRSRAADLAGLAGLLPAQAFEGLDDDAALLIVPLGSLWAIPWPAFPAGDKFLGERFKLAIAPSLTLADHVRGGGELPMPRTVGQWRSPRIKHHELVAFADDARVELDRLGSAEDALTAVTVGARHDLIVLAGHGKPIPGLVHYLELDTNVLLTPAALLDARTPEQLVLAACWGAHAPGAAESDPLTLATSTAAASISGSMSCRTANERTSSQSAIAAPEVSQASRGPDSRKPARTQPLAGP